MDDKKTRILDAAIRTFARYGWRRTTIGDIADGSGVSRQTLYTHFANKDDILNETIKHLNARLLSSLREAWDREKSLSGRIDSYFQLSILEPYEWLRSSPDAQDFLAGANASAKAAVQAGYGETRQLLEQAFAENQSAIESNGQTAADLANFVQKSSVSFKYSAENKQELERLLRSIKAAALALCADHHKT